LALDLPIEYEGPFTTVSAAVLSSTVHARSLMMMIQRQNKSRLAWTCPNSCTRGTTYIVVINDRGARIDSNDVIGSRVGVNFDQKPGFCFLSPKPQDLVVGIGFDESTAVT